LNSNDFDLKGRTALITGSGRGLGFCIARGLGMAGAQVVLNGRNRKQLEDAAEKLKAGNLPVRIACFDVTDKHQIAAGIQEIENQIGPLDILVNNAGIQKRGSLETIDEADWRAVIDVNLTGVFLTSQQAVQGMMKRRRGKIINICSLMSEIGRKTIGPYTAAKGGLKMLTRAMALEWAAYNIQVNGIGPGYFITEMTKPLVEDPEFDTWIKSRTPAGRWGDPDELVGPAVFLASDASSFVTGQILYVDGGVLSTI